MSRRPCWRPIRSNLRAKLFAISTWASVSSEVKLYTNICISAGVQPFPISNDKLLTAVLFINVLVIFCMLIILVIASYVKSSR